MVVDGFTSVPDPASTQEMPRPAGADPLHDLGEYLAALNIVAPDGGWVCFVFMLIDVSGCMLYIFNYFFYFRDASAGQCSNRE